MAILDRSDLMWEPKSQIKQFQYVYGLGVSSKNCVSVQTPEDPGQRESLAPIAQSLLKLNSVRPASPNNKTTTKRRMHFTLCSG